MTTPQTSAAATAAVSPEQLGADLAQFTGTEHYYRHPLSRRVVFTDGVKYFADTVGAYWLLDILATELPKFVLKHGIIFIDCVVKNGNAALSARTDAGKPSLWERAIDFTDLPEADWLFYMVDGGPDDAVVIMLPSEY